tara:strand:- start:322 stop:624 length:303 start_codon:yes stop_codon:yes gene_type:complete
LDITGPSRPDLENLSPEFLDHVFGPGASLWWDVVINERSGWTGAIVVAALPIGCSFRLPQFQFTVRDGEGGDLLLSEDGHALRELGELRELRELRVAESG